MVRSYQIIEGTDLYFCTDVIVGWQYVFTSPDMSDIIIDSLEYCRQNKGLRLHAYVIMPNHVHTIISAREGRLSDIIRDYKRYTSTQISEQLAIHSNRRLLRYFSTTARLAGRGNEFKIWQTGNHPIILASEVMFRQRFDYIHNNPVRKGFVDRPEQWRYSSGRNYYDGDNSVIHIDMIE